jgi:hypothetical protein
VNDVPGCGGQVKRAARGGQRNNLHEANLEAAPGFEPACRGQLETDQSLPPGPTRRVDSP